jgi:hypothetical protein
MAEIAPIRPLDEAAALDWLRRHYSTRTYADGKAVLQSQD